MIFTGLSVVNTQIWGEDRAKKVLAGIEKGIQNECEEHIRIMNERDMTGRPVEGEGENPNLQRDKDIRKMVLNIRDESYDFVERQQMIVDEDKAGADMPQDQYYLYQASKYATVGMMRLARKV